MSVNKGKADSGKWFNFIPVDLWFVRFYSARDKNLIYQPASAERWQVDQKASDMDQ